MGRNGGGGSQGPVEREVAAAGIPLRMETSEAAHRPNMTTSTTAEEQRR